MPTFVNIYFWLPLTLTQSGIAPSTSAQPTIDKLKMIFAMHGLSMTLVLNNSPPLQSAEFHSFMIANSIVHSCVPPYHPSSNRLVENMVKAVKQALSKNKLIRNATIISRLTLLNS